MTNTERAKRIKMLVMDVDGTLTDSSMYFSAEGEMLKKFSTRDGMGITLLHRAGIQTAIMTSEDSPIVTARAIKLQIPHVILGSKNKTVAIRELVARTSVNTEDIAYIGDDVNDMQVMGLCGLSACPSDAVDSIKDIANIVCMHLGGNGAVREFAEFILKAQGKPITLPEQW